MSRWKQGDTKPDLVIDCFDGAGERPDFTTVDTLTVIMQKRGEVIWEREVEGTANGVITMELTPQDTANVGTFFLKVRAVWPEGHRQHYPPADTFMTVTITG